MFQPRIHNFVPGQFYRESIVATYSKAEKVSSRSGLLQPPHKIKLSNFPLVTVAVCTRDRQKSLSRCLQSLLKLNYPNYEILVIDNASKSFETAAMVGAIRLQTEAIAHLSATKANGVNHNGKNGASKPKNSVEQPPKVRYVLERRPGLDWARNRAIEEANGEIIAFTDDDVVADPYWLLTLVQTFQVLQADCVTGNVLPYQMETRAQFLFELYGGFSRGFQRRICTADSNAGMSYPVASHHFGTGANMAFRKSAFERIGSFDTALDVGTPSGGAGDLEIFFRTIKSGCKLVFEPNALVWHVHRSEYKALRRQICANGTSYYAYLTRTFVHYPEERGKVVRFALWWMMYWNIRRLVKEIIKPTGLPLDLILAELYGSFKGPFAYFASRRLSRTIAKNHIEDPSISKWLEGEPS